MASEDGPRDIFKAGGRTPSTPRKSRRPSTPKSKQPTPPGGGARAPPTPPGGGKSDTKKMPSEEKSPKSSTKVETDKKSRGLKKPKSPPQSTTDSKIDDRAKEIIDRVTVPNSTIDTKIVPPKPVEPLNPFTKKKQQPQRRNSGRNRRAKHQAPTKRVRKLHRGKYMEFKYDVRKILEEESVEEEHRSNVLGQTWAKGERQGVSEAKEFLEEKVTAGIITESCANRIIKLMDSLTTKR